MKNNKIVGPGPKYRRPVATKSNQWHSTKKDYNRQIQKGYFKNKTFPETCETCRIDLEINTEEDKCEHCLNVEWMDEGEIRIEQFIWTLTKIKILKVISYWERMNHKDHPLSHSIYKRQLERFFLGRDNYY